MIFCFSKEKLEKKIIQFYAAEIVNILEFLHLNGIAHRDMKVYNFYKKLLFFCFYQSLKI